MISAISYKDMACRCLRHGPRLCIAVALLLSGSLGCTTPTGNNAGNFNVFASEADRQLADSLAHYASALLHEVETPGDLDAIANQYTEAVQYGNVPARLYSEAATASIRAKDTQRAIEILQRACKEYPDITLLQAELGGAYRIAGNLEAALTHFDNARKLEPAQPFSYLAIAAIHFEQNRDDRAFEILGKALEQTDADADITRACYGQGSRYFRDNQPERAIACFDFVAQHVPEQRAAIYHLVAELYLTEKKQEEARQYLEKALTEPGTMPETFVRFAALLEKDDPGRAIEILNQGLKAHPDNPLFLQLLGEIYRSQNRLEEAIRVLEQATRSDRPSPESYISLAVVLAADQPQRAIQVLEEAATRLPDDTTILFVLARLHGENQNHARAVEVFEKIREVIDNSDSIEPSERFFLYYGGATEQSGDIEKASEIFEEGVALFPESHEMLNYAAYMWSEKNMRLDQALSYVQRALKIVPENPAYIDTLGWIYYQQKKYSAALTELRKANDLMPGDPILNDHLGDAYDALGDTERALKHWTSSLELDPQNEPLVKKLREKGIDVDAILERIRTEEPDSKGPAEAPSP